MAWELSSWLALIRTFQLLGALAGAALNGFVSVMIFIKDRDLLHNIVILELLICLALCYTIVAITVQHSGQRSKKPGWLICFLMFDLIACGMSAAIVFFLQDAGLPSNCVGLSAPGSPPADLFSEFTTDHFSTETDGQRGELDRLCAFERSYFFIALGLIVTYLITILLTVLRIRESKKQRSRSTKDSETGDDDIDLKTFDASSPLTSTPSPVTRSPVEQQQQQQQQQEPQPRQQLPQHTSTPSEGIITRNTSIRSSMTSSTASHGRSYSRISIPPAPPSEGIITRNTSIRSTMTSSTASHGAPSYFRGAVPNRRPVGQQSEFSSPPPVPSIGSPHVLVRRPVLPPRPTPPYEGPSSSASTNNMTGMGQGFVPIPLEDDDDDDDFAGALVADGMQHQQRQQNEQQAQFTRQRIQMQSQMPMLPEDEQLAAEHALVSDGMRPSEPMLPPYEPGPNRMPGHGGEDNELRLSEYVKGQTRAQDMKDSGRY